MKAFFILFIVYGCALIITTAWGDSSSSSCAFYDPLFDTLSHQKVKIQQPKHYYSNQENFVIIELEKPHLPIGYMVRVLVEDLKYPVTPPSIEPWYPNTMIKPLNRGTYEMVMSVNLLYRSS